MTGPATVHGTAVQIDGHGVLIRGPSGSGKSTLARLLLDRARRDGRPGLLVADDRVVLTRDGDGLLAAPPPALAGLLEVAGLGIVEMPFTAPARLALVIDLVPAGRVERLPDAASRRIRLDGAIMSHLEVAALSPLAPGLVELALDALVTGRIRLRP